MPWMVPSHPAPALVLKAWKPAWFSGLGLVLGTVAPDLAFILRLDNNAVVAHTFAGQLYVTVPLVLVLHGLLTALVLPWLLPLLPDGPPLHLHTLAAVRPAATRGEWVKVALSGLVGGLSHVLLDGFTHGNQDGWAVAYLPGLRMPLPFVLAGVPWHDALHGLSTLVLGALALHLWARLVQEGRLWAWSGAAPRGVEPASPPARRREATWFLGCAALGALIAPALRPGASIGLALELAAYGAIAFLFYGAVIGALSARWRSAIRPRRVPADGAAKA